VKRIASADNPHYKALLKLAQNARERKRQSRALLDGVHLVEACRDHCGKPELIAVSDSGFENPEIKTLLAPLEAKKLDSLSLRERVKGEGSGKLASIPKGVVEVLILADNLFKRLSTVETPTGILAVIAKPKPMASKLTETCILLEDIQDAGNLGSILRSAAAAGVKEVFLSKYSVDAWSPRVLRAGMGAHFLLNIHEDSDLIAVVRGFKGKVLAATQKASKSLFDADLRGPAAFAFGNEGSGLSPEMLGAADEAIAVPMAHDIESLNVAAAMAICLFERTRQLR